MEALYVIIAVLAGIGVGVAIARALGVGKSTNADKAAEIEAQRILDAAKTQVDEIKRAAQVDGKELAIKLKNELEDELRSRKQEVAKKEEALGQRDRDLEKRKKDAERKDAELGKRERSLEGKERAAAQALTQAETAL